MNAGSPFDVDASPVAWREAGSGPVIVFLHGLGGSRTAWEPQLRGLSDRWRCVAWDLPGYGASAPFDGPMTWGKAAQALIGLLDELGTDRADLVGMSLGGMVALHAVLEHPDRVRSLVLLASSPAFGLDGVTTAEGWKAERLAPLAEGRTLGELADYVLPRLAGADASPEALRAAILAMSRIPAAGFEAAVECLPTHDVRSRLGQIRAPVLVLVGAHDTETPPSYGRYLADHLPAAQLSMIPGAGHLLNLEAPEQVNESIRSFLREMSSSGS